MATLIAASCPIGARSKDYLRLRRALGFKLKRAGWLLPQLVAYLEAAGAATITSDLAIAPAGEVPPPGVFPTRRHRATPYLWSRSDSCRLLEGARALRSPLRAATHEALFGLLAATGAAVAHAARCRACAPGS